MPDRVGKLPLADPEIGGAEGIRSSTVRLAASARNT